MPRGRGMPSTRPAWGNSTAADSSPGARKGTAFFLNGRSLTPEARGRIEPLATNDTQSFFRNAACRTS